MSAPAKVLIIGMDEVPVGQIGSVLMNFWAVRSLVGRAAIEPAEQVEKGEDLVVLCQSFAEPERQQWLDRLRAAYPSLLVVKINGYDSGPHAGADATVDYEHGPAALVATIYELLTERGLSSRRWMELPPSPWVQ